MTKANNVFETKFKVSKYKAPEYTILNTGLKESIDGIFKEAITKDPKYGKILKESMNFKEAGEGQTTTSDSGAYTTLLQQIIQTAMISDKELATAEKLVFINTDMVESSGYGAYQIPRMQPTSALEIAEGSVVSYFDEGVEPIVVVPKKYVASTKITWEIRKRGMGSLMNYILGNAKDALVRKRISNIVNGLAAGAGITVTGGLSYANFLEARKAVRSAESSSSVRYNFLPNWFVVSSDYYNDIVLDDSFQKAMFPGNANNNVSRNEFGILAPMRVLDCTIWETPLLTGAQALVLDSTKAGMLCKESEYEMFEGRLPTSPDTEILALISEVLAMVFPKACAKITA